MNKTFQFGAGLGFHKVDSATIEGEYIAFNDGTRILGRHVTSITLFDTSNQIMGTAIGAGVFFFIMGLSIMPASGAAGFFFWLIGGGVIWLITKNIQQGVQLVCSSGERWVVMCPDRAATERYRDELQSKIFNTTVATAGPVVNNTLAVDKAEVKPASIADELAKLKRLHEAGTLDDSEYKTLKDSLIRKAA